MASSSAFPSLVQLKIRLLGISPMVWRWGVGPLLCNREGCPVAVEVFDGNTADPSTVGVHNQKLRQRFALSRVVLVGDRGMLAYSGAK